MEDKKYDVIIMGSGPAGLTAGIYSSRYKLDTLIIGKLNGGLMTETHKICNFPTEKEIDGFSLTQKMEDNARLNGVQIINKEIKDIIKTEDGFKVVTSDGKTFLSKAVILAFGTQHRRLNLENEESLLGRGVSYCATCDGLFFKNKKVAVVGGGDSALTSALYLADVAEKVYLIHRGNKFRAEPIWVEKVNSSNKIEILFNSQVTKLIGKEKLEAITLSDQSELSVDGLFIEIGTEPQKYDFINTLGIKTDDRGYIEVDSSQKTSCPGIWAAGDVTNGSNNFRQIITACSEGAIAANSVFEFTR